MSGAAKDTEIKTFKNYCTCGGYAWQMNGRPQAQPHMAWCGQRDEYAEWYARRSAALSNGTREGAT